MKATKKVLLTVLALSLVVAAVLGMVACSKPVQMRETEILITLDKSIMSDIEGKTLKDYLDLLQEKEYLTYEATAGMLYTLNDRKADSTAGEWWLIYTDDADHSNEDWGKYTVEDKTYYSSTLGYESLPLKEGATYVFVISKF